MRSAVDSERLMSRAGIKLAGTYLLAGSAGVWFLGSVLTVSVGWMLRPLLVAAVVLAVGITIGFALRAQAGDTK